MAPLREALKLGRGVKKATKTAAVVNSDEAAAALQKKVELDEHVQLYKEAPRSLLIECYVIFVFDLSHFLSVLFVQTSSCHTSSFDKPHRLITIIF